jgi:hypothetical protein
MDVQWKIDECKPRAKIPALNISAISVGAAPNGTALAIKAHLLRPEAGSGRANDANSSSSGWSQDCTYRVEA